jgi:glucose/arabinose dehydrogenase
MVLLLGALCVGIDDALAAQQPPPAGSISALAGPRLRVASAELAVALAEAAHPRSLSPGGFAPRSGRGRSPAAGQQPPGGARAGGPGGRGNATATLFASTCAPCHGTDLAGGRAPSLFSERLLASNDDDALVAKIRDGVPNTAMAPFKGTLDEQQIWQLVAYIRTQAANLKDKPAFVPDPNNQIVKSERQTFRIEVVVPGLETPWGLAFLPDGRLLVTERPGRLRIIEKDGDKGKLVPDPVQGTPKVWERQDSGMLDVAVHPQYAKNGWVYLAYSEVVPGYVAPPPAAAPADPGVATGARGRGRGGPPSPPSMTVFVRGKIDKSNRWVEEQVIYRAPADLYTPSGSHYGTRFLFDKNGHVFYSLGERGDMTNAQDLSKPLGKIHRVNDDGSIPKDNPFVNTPNALPSIWTYGHRNPQGLAWDSAGLLWESEHGPTGGDEINIIEKGKNYGWGVISMGLQNGITERSHEGMEQPIAYFTPTIAPSGIGFYFGSKYPAWKNNLFVAALAGQQLRRLEISGRKVIHQEVVFEQFGRVRAVTTGPDGLLYVLLQNPTGSGTGAGLSASTPGMVIRLVPAGQK